MKKNHLLIFGLLCFGIITVKAQCTLGITISSVTNVSCNGGTGTVIANAATGGTPFLTFTYGNISTVAGNGTSGYNSDNIAATSAELSSPQGVAVDASGNIYIADVVNNRIRKVNTSGTITTVAGNGTAGYSGNTGNATAAELDFPAGVAVDGSGNIYLADEVNNVIRKVSTSGTITTIAGGGSSISNGIAATAEQLLDPDGVAVDKSGNVYIADGTNRVLKINSSGIINTIAGNTTAGYNGDGIAATAAELHGSAGVAVDAAGNVYIADELNQRIRKINTSGTISTVAGNGTGAYSGDGSNATAAELNEPSGVAVDANENIYIGDYLNKRVRVVNSSGIISTLAGNGTLGFSGDGAAATAAELASPEGVAADGSGHVFVADLGNERIRKITPSSTTSSYIYLWSPGGTTNLTVTNLSAGTYTITASDNGGCTASATATVTQPAALTATASVTTYLSCAGGTGGAVGVAVSGGTSPYTYSWSTGATSSSLTGLSAGGYLVTVTDAHKCSISSIVGLSDIAVNISSVTNISCYGNNTGSASVSTSASPVAITFPYTGKIQSFALPASAAGTATISVMGAAGGTYSIYSVGGSGTSFSGICTVVPGNILSIAVGGMGSANGFSYFGGGGGTFVWDATANSLFAAAAGGGGASDGSIIDAQDAGGPGGTDLVGNSTTSTGNANNANGGMGGNGGNGGNTGTGAAGGGGGGAGWLSNGSNGTGISEYGLGGNDYSNGFSGGSYYSNGAVGGFGGGGGGNFGGGGGGGYNGGGGGNGNDAVTIDGSVSYGGGGGGGSYLNGTVIGTPVATNTGNGSASITYLMAGGASPYIYSWSNGKSTSTITGLSAGNYSVTVTDAHGCTATSSVTITQPSGPLACNISITSNVNCNGNSNGSINAPASGGTSPYTYSWSNGITNSVNSGLSAGSYTVNVKDANACSFTSSVTLTQPASPLGITIATYSPSACSFNGGSATANAAIGGTPPYTYSWSYNGGTNLTASNLIATLYTITVTDNNNCTAMATVQILGSNPVQLEFYQQTNISCYGGTASAYVIDQNGNSDSYSWSPIGDFGATASNLSAGTYTVSAISTNYGCMDAITVTITQPAAPLSVSIQGAYPDLCDYNGLIAANAATGGTPPYTYSWSPSGGTNLDINNVPAGSYTITVTDHNDCTNTASIGLSPGNPPVYVNVATVNNISCYGGTGSATVNTNVFDVQYGDGNLFWLPSGGSGTSASNLSAGTYTVNVSAQGGSCFATCTVTITQPTQLGISLSSVANVTCNSEGSIIANSATGGVSPYTYSWSVGGGAGLTASNLSAGTYTVTVTDNSGCSSSTSATITQPASPLAITLASVTNGGCSTSGSVTANAAMGGTPPYTYSWSPSGGSSLFANGLSGGTFTITATDNNGCTATASATITQSSGLGVSLSSVINPSCNPNSGSITFNSPTGGTPPYTYAWIPSGGNNLTATGLSGGTYTIITLDNSGCLIQTSATITQSAGILKDTAIVTGNITCNGASNGSGYVSISSGLAPFTYLWSNGATVSSISELSAGTYSITVQDNNGCSATQSMIIRQPAAINISMVIQSNVSCYGGGNGTAKVGVSGGSSPYTYSWSSGSTAYLASNLSAGTYSVTVTDKNGCSKTALATITQPVALSSSVNITYPNCMIPTGSASIGVSGGTLPYVYTWSPPVTTTATATGLSARTYVVSVKDAHGCVSALTFVISQPPILRDSIIRTSIVEVSCGSTNNGSATVGVKYGTQPYTYSWSMGSTTASASGLTLGTYSVVVRDANMCSALATLTISQAGGLNISTIIQNNVSCYGSSNGVAKAGVSGGILPYTYSWSPGGSTTYMANGLSAGTYTVSITDRNGCSNSATAIITQPAAIRDSIAYINNATCHGSTGSAGIGIKGGTPPYTYTWSPPESTTAIAIGLTARTYVVSIKDADGCTASLVFTITQPFVVRDSIVRTATVNVLCNGLSTGSATLGVKYGTQPYTYSWSNGSITATANGMSAGTYSVTIVDGCGNSATSTVSITQPNALRDSISSSSCTGGLITANVGVRGGVAPYTYSWSPNVNTTSRASGLSAGTYTITVTDKNGCPVAFYPVLSCNAAPVEGEYNNTLNNQCCPGELNSINLYPNPNNGLFIITGIEKGMYIEVYDYTGRKISSICSTKEQMQLNISNESNGIYLIRITDKNGNLVSQKKVVKTQ